ncbi:START-like domain superfamily [Sesbania bispinosa]|nr:START-like domain superfamily [Sesbania bispinosa]
MRGGGLRTEHRGGVLCLASHHHEDLTLVRLYCLREVLTVNHCPPRISVLCAKLAPRCVSGASSAVTHGEGSSDVNKASLKSSKKGSTSSRKSVVSANEVELFKSPEHELWYNKAVKKKRIVHDRSIDINEDDCEEIYHTITPRGWQKFCDTAGMGYYSLAREFYANAHHDKQEEPTHVSFVGGKEVCFDAQTINKVLKIKLASHPRPSGYELYRHEELHEDIAEILCKPGVGSILDNKGQIKGSKMGDLKPIPKAWKVIVQEMDKIVVSEKQTLAYPSIITLLCHEAKLKLAGDDKIKPYPSITKGSISHFEYHYDLDSGKQPQRVPPTRMISKDQRLKVLPDRQNIMQHSLYSLRQGITFGFQKLNHRYECLENMIVQLKHRIKTSSQMNYHVLKTFISMIQLLKSKIKIAYLILVKVRSVSHEIKFKPNAKGGHKINTVSKYHPKLEVEINEEEIKAGKERVLGIYKVVETYLLQNPDVYA